VGIFPCFCWFEPLQECVYSQTPLTGLQSFRMPTHGIPINGLEPLTQLTAGPSPSPGPGNCTGCGNNLQDKIKSTMEWAQHFPQQTKGPQLSTRQKRVTSSLCYYSCLLWSNTVLILPGQSLIFALDVRVQVHLGAHIL
jgi:hypothetical protein